MRYECDDSRIPGTRLLRKDYDNQTGMAFLNRIFYLDDAVMLGQVRAISGVDTSTLQNWVKRGWLLSTVNRRYTKEHLARILILNMLRPVMQLEEIDRLLHFVNGETETTEDDILSESDFYDMICCCIDTLSGMSHVNSDTVHAAVQSCCETFEETVPQSRVRLQKALCVILPAYFASLVVVDARASYRELVK